MFDAPDSKYLVPFDGSFRVANVPARPRAPWYALPADINPFMQARFAEIIVAAPRSIGLTYPTPSPEDLARIEASRKALNSD